ncbi:MAG: hypothetical protein ABSD46_01290 [Bacteroidota bacterium]
MVQPEPKNHPSGDNRFKLLDRAITKHHASGDVLIEILHVELLSAGGEVLDEVRR